MDDRPRDGGRRVRRLVGVAAAVAVVVACGPTAPLGTSADAPADPQVDRPTGAGATTAPEAHAAASGSGDGRDATVPAMAGRTARLVATTGFAPFASVGGVVLRHPSDRVERVSFHESNHDGARDLTVLGTAVRPLTLETRERGTGVRTAADVVVDPSREIRAPVSGTVQRAGTYVLYCDHSDDFVVIAPDARPDWEVKVLHISGVRVRAGDRVEAGVSVLAPGPTPLPFRSQVDDDTAEPSWPHVHLEVVDPSIPDRPSGGSC